jgi:hypothetical protein
VASGGKWLILLGVDACDPKSAETQESLGGRLLSSLSEGFNPTAALRLRYAGSLNKYYEALILMPQTESAFQPQMSGLAGILRPLKGGVGRRWVSCYGDFVRVFHPQPSFRSLNAIRAETALESFPPPASSLTAAATLRSMIAWLTRSRFARAARRLSGS